MLDLCRLIWCALIGLFRSRAALEAEILVLRHQLNVLRRKSPKRLAFGNVDRLVFAGLYRAAPGRPFCAIMPTVFRRWICSWSRRSRFGCFMDFSFCGIPAVSFSGWL